MKNKKIYLVIAIVLIGLLISGGSFAYWNWLSNENKTVVFNTSKNIQEYIVYDEGESKFVGDFKVGNSYLDGVHTTVSIHKTSEAANIILYASINMRIKEIGANLANSEGLKWAITSGDSTSGGEVLASGDFYGSKGNDEFIILDNIEVTETLTSYTVWIWLDEGYATSEMTGEKIDTAIWTQVDQYPENNFEVTNLSNNYQVINATVVNSDNNIVSYAVTDSNIEPVKNKIDKVVASPLVSRSNDSELTMLADSTNWIDIPVEDQKKVYVFKYVVNNTGTYYLWFKDSADKVISKEITVNDISTDKPVCTWSNPGSSAIKDGESTTISLTCIDTSSKIIDSDISISDISVSSNSIVVSDNIVKERINNGHKYTFTVSTGSDTGSSTIIVPANMIINEFNLGNDEVISPSITYSAVYNITYKDVGGIEFSGVHESGYPQTYNSGEETILDLPSKNGYTFNGYYLNSDGTGNKVPSISNTQTGDITLYAKWIDNVLPYGVANLSLTDGVFTLTLSNYGDDGSGLTGTYGFSLISSGSCENATYEYQTELSKTYNDSYVDGTTYYGCIKLEDNDGNISYLKSSGITMTYGTDTQTYTTSGESTFTVPKTGIYKLEVWGAQGGSGNTTYIGGYGGYSVGNVQLDIDSTLYINIGGKGAIKTGGYNGGGNSGSTSYSGGGGGGATHIATVSGKLSALSSYTGNNDSPILIVAGGGGGSVVGDNNSSYGGAGGGYIGNSVKSSTSNYSNPTGGTQSTGGTKGSRGSNGEFGIGGNGDSWSGGGGGGYYGGGGGFGAGGGGGSGYIGNSLLTDKYMYCYNCTTSDDVSTKTYTTTNVSDTPTSDYAKSGDGAARITWSIINNQSTIILTYDNQGGSGCYSKSVTSGSTYGELCTPVKSGYSFDGWYTEVSSGTEITSSTTVSETVDYTIYAHWTKATNPVITFSNNGNSEYVSGNVSSIITVSKGSYDLDYNSFKYIYSTDMNATPDTIFYRGYEYTLENATGIYYLIAKACDVNGNCTTEVSNPFYVDNSAPSGSLILNTGKSSINIEVNASDQGSGINTYEYLATLDSSCPTIGYVSSSNSSYTVYLSESGNYTVCVRITDKAGNNIIISDNIELERKTTLPYGRADLSLNDGIFTLSLSDYGDEGEDLLNTFGFALISNGNCEIATYEYQEELSKIFSGNYISGTIYYGCIKLEDSDGNITYVKSAEIQYVGSKLLSSYSCSNSSVGNSPYNLTYTGKCTVIDDGDNSWRVKFLSSGNLTISGINNTKNTLDVFLVGGGGGGVSGNGKGGGGGGYTLTKSNIVIDNGISYEVVIGAGGTAGKNGGASSAFGYSASGGYTGSSESGGAGGSGGGNGAPSDGNGYSGGSDGGNGGGGNGKGQGTTTREFGSSSGTLYAGGGGGGGYDNNGYANSGGSGGSGGGGSGGSGWTNGNLGGCSNGTENTGGGGGGAGGSSNYSSTGCTGGTGIVIIKGKDYVKNKSSIVLTYDNQGGNGCYSKSIITDSAYGELCTPIKEGYKFDGWYTEANDGTEITSSTMVSETVDHTIYAHWTEVTNPVITFSNNGNSGYVSDNISSVITVSKGSYDLDEGTFKYIYSTNIDDTPAINFVNDNNVVLENATGIYYLIAQACDVNGNCTTEISNPFYVDNDNPTGEITSMSSNVNVLTVNVSASDSGSGIKEYGYLVQTDSTCPLTGYVSSNNSSYTFNVPSSGVYYVCVKIIDNVGNVNIISESVLVEFEINYENISSNYSCANSSAGTTPIFTYNGDCEVIDDGNGDYRIKFLTSGELTLNASLSVDLFLVGGGGGGGSGDLSGGGGGGYTKTYPKQKIASGVYQIQVGSGGAAGANGGQSYFGSNNLYYANGGNSGSSGNRPSYYGGAGGDGGSGGGGSHCDYDTYNYGEVCTRCGSTSDGSGGRFGNSGTSGGSGGCTGGAGSSGQGTTTCEFGEGTLTSCQTGVTEYSKGGSPSEYSNNYLANSGNGGYGDGAGSSGIVIIRSARIIEVNGTKIGTYTGGYEIIDEGSNNWKIKFISSGTLNLTTSLNVDIFVVGGGGGGGSGCSTSLGNYCQAGGGGGGGYTKTYSNVSLSATSYAIKIGSGGSSGNDGEMSYFGDSSAYYANGGGAGTSSDGGSGGSGGGSASCCRKNTEVNFYSIRSDGGLYGSDGGSCSSDCPYQGDSSGGTGQGSTTCEFGLGTTSSCNSGVTVYSQGGTGSTWIENSGNGGNVSSSGSSGIVIIRNKR